MGTRAVITFIDEDNTFHVYKHWGRRSHQHSAQH